MLVGITHTAVAVDVDVTWGSEGLSQEWGCWERERLASSLPLSPPGRPGCGEGWELTRRKATTKEHVEEVFRGDVGLKATVEVPMPMAVTGCLALVITELVILLPLLRVAKYCICCANG